MAESHIVEAIEALLEHLYNKGLMTEMEAHGIHDIMVPPAAAEPAARKTEAGVTWPTSRVFTFGKHYGCTVEEVLGSNPGYLVWATENVEDFVLNRDVLEQAIAGKEEESVRFHASRGSAARAKPYQSTFGPPKSSMWDSDPMDDEDDVPF